MASSSSDPRRDCAQIARELAHAAFPWDTTRSLELALFRTFASPRIGGLLRATREFEERAQRALGWLGARRLHAGPMPAVALAEPR